MRRFILICAAIAMSLAVCDISEAVIIRSRRVVARRPVVNVNVQPQVLQLQQRRNAIQVRSAVILDNRFGHVNDIALQNQLLLQQQLQLQQLQLQNQQLHSPLFLNGCR